MYSTIVIVFVFCQLFFLLKKQGVENPPRTPPLTSQLRLLVVPILKLVKLCARLFASLTADPISTILKSGKSKMIFNDFKMAFKKSNQSEVEK